jgi:hypothetical protein
LSGTPGVVPPLRLGKAGTEAPRTAENIPSTFADHYVPMAHNESMSSLGPSYPQRKPTPTGQSEPSPIRQAHSHLRASGIRPVRTQKHSTPPPIPVPLRTIDLRGAVIFRIRQQSSYGRPPTGKRRKTCKNPHGATSVHAHCRFHVALLRSEKQRLYLNKIKYHLNII